jgi:hypothetical protein
MPRPCPFRAKFKKGGERAALRGLSKPIRRLPSVERGQVGNIEVESRLSRKGGVAA